MRSSALAPLVILLVVLGFFPRPLTAIINPAVADTLQQVGAKDPAPAVPAESATGGGQETAK